jgi:hypothetical protein
MGNTRQTLEASRIVQIAQQGGDAASAQQTHPLRRRSQGHQTHALALGCTQLARRAQAHIATAHDQNTLATKTGGQCTQGGLV